MKRSSIGQCNAFQDKPQCTLREYAWSEERERDQKSEIWWPGCPTDPSHKWRIWSTGLCHWQAPSTLQFHLASRHKSVGRGGRHSHALASGNPVQKCQPRSQTLCKARYVVAKSRYCCWAALPVCCNPAWEECRPWPACLTESHHNNSLAPMPSLLAKYGSISNKNSAHVFNISI